MSPALPQNPILSDLAFANLPWRAAVRESLAHGRLPLWNRFVLAGSPLLGTAQAGVFHPSTWLGIWLPVPLSWTFSCTFTLFLGLLAGFLFFGDFGLGARAALVGAVGWGFSTYVVFWNGWSVGPSTATFPLLLLGLRRLAREPGLRATGLDGRGALPLVLRRPPGVLLPLAWRRAASTFSGSSRASRGGSGRARPGWPSAPARSRCCCAGRSSSRCSRRSRTRRSTARGVGLSARSRAGSRSRSARRRRGCCPTRCRSPMGSTGRAGSKPSARTDPECRSDTRARCSFRSRPSPSPRARPPAAARCSPVSRWPAWRTARAFRASWT